MGGFTKRCIKNFTWGKKEMDREEKRKLRDRATEDDKSRISWFCKVLGGSHPVPNCCNISEKEEGKWRICLLKQANEFSSTYCDLLLQVLMCIYLRLVHHYCKQTKVSAVNQSLSSSYMVCCTSVCTRKQLFVYMSINQFDLFDLY